MNQDSPKLQEKPDPPAAPPDSSADLPPNLPELDPATGAEEDEEARLPEIIDAGAEAVAEGPLAVGRAAIERAVRLAPVSSGVYRMLNAAGDVLYVGKAKSVRKRLASYARPTGQPNVLAQMIAATATVEIVSTTTENEALLL